MHPSVDHESSSLFSDPTPPFYSVYDSMNHRCHPKNLNMPRIMGARSKVAARCTLRCSSGLATVDCWCSAAAATDTVSLLGGAGAPCARSMARRRPGSLVGIRFTMQMRGGDEIVSISLTPTESVGGRGQSKTTCSMQSEAPR